MSLAIPQQSWYERRKNMTLPSIYPGKSKHGQTSRISVTHTVGTNAPALLSLPCRLHLPPAQGLCRCCSLCLKSLPCSHAPLSSHQLLLSPQSHWRVWSEEPAPSTMHSRKSGPFCSPHLPVFITSLFAQFCDLVPLYGFKPAHLPYTFNQFFLFGGKKTKINCDLTIVL